ncbi:hypothetical protein BH11BAC7_BH11BAC7_34800 [soil metagenome]
MSTQKLSNISLSQFESFLELCCCKFIKNEKGHAKYFRSDLNRPIIFQNHKDPVPEFIIKNNLRVLGVSKKDFFCILDLSTTVIKVSDSEFKLVSAIK